MMEQRKEKKKRRITRSVERMKNNAKAMIEKSGGIQRAFEEFWPVFACCTEARTTNCVAPVRTKRAIVGI